MLYKSLSTCPSIIANDGCHVFELLHPHRDGVNLPYSLAVAEVLPQERSYRHRLNQNEVYYILAGRGLMHIDDETRELTVGDAVMIPAGAVQWIENLQAETLRFVALVSPPWRPEDDIRLDDPGITVIR
jgi:mannose-6-phosphate isomerase-like protein (cupin superfamily)